MSAPPGYSGESLLSGGVGDIKPVMGGGFNVTAFVQLPPTVLPPVHSGGAKDSDKDSDKKSDKDSDKKSDKDSDKDSDKESDKPSDKAPEKPKTPRIEYYSVNSVANIPLQKFTENQVKTMLKRAVRASAIDQVKNAFTGGHPASYWHPMGATDAPTLASLSNCENPATVIPTLTRLVHVLPADTETIVVIPAVNGNVARFDYFLTFLTDVGIASNTPDEIGTIADKTCVIFLPSFFKEGTSESDTQTTAALMYMFMKFKNANPGKVFLLAEHTVGNMKVGCLINKTFSEKPTDPLINMMEPSYILFPEPVGKFPKLLFTSAVEGEPLLKSATAEVEDNYYGVSPTDPTPDVADYLTFTSNQNTAIPGAASVGICTDLLYNTVLDESPGIVGLERGDKIAVIRLYADDVPLCKRKTALDGAPQFYAANIKATAKGPVISVFHNGKSYAIRRPIGRVQSNWMAGVFTDDEADFLRDMSLTPILLGKVYPNENWLERLKRFLVTVSVSKCFSDEALLTYKECGDARQFVRDVEQYLMMNDPRISEAIVEPVDTDKAPTQIPNTNGEVFAEVRDEEFSSAFHIGDNKVYHTLKGISMPVLLASKKRKAFLLYELRIDKDDATKEDLLTVLSKYKQQYSGWLFLT